MKHRTRWLAGFSAVLLALVVAATASGYTGQVEGSVSVGAHSTVTCHAPFTITATILDATGTPISGDSVVWSFVNAPSRSDKINDSRTVTNSHGVATTTVRLAPVSGTRRIRATAGDLSASAVLSPLCAGLPRTSTLPTNMVPGQDSLLAVLLALAFAAGGGLILRRRASMRR
jgi:hypothetical protein